MPKIHSGRIYAKRFCQKYLKRITGDVFNVDLSSVYASYALGAGITYHTTLDYDSFIEIFKKERNLLYAKD